MMADIYVNRKLIFFKNYNAFRMLYSVWMKTVMAKNFSDKIKQYCERFSVEIPLGFYRHPANRYVAIDMDCIPPKLIAKTWFNQEDVVYYLKNFAVGRKIHVLDFEKQQKIIFESGEKLKRGEEF